jgi:hypothetical protein
MRDVRLQQLVSGAEPKAEPRRQDRKVEGNRAEVSRDTSFPTFSGECYSELNVFKYSSVERYPNIPGKSSRPTIGDTRVANDRQCGVCRYLERRLFRHRCQRASGERSSNHAQQSGYPIVS